MTEQTTPTVEEVLISAPDHIGEYAEFDDQEIEEERLNAVIVGTINELNSHFGKVANWHDRFVSRFESDGSIEAYSDDEKDAVVDKLYDELKEYPERLLETVAWGFDASFDRNDTGEIIINHERLVTVLKGFDASNDSLRRIGRILDDLEEESASGSKGTLLETIDEMYEMRRDVLQTLFDTVEVETGSQPNLWEHMHPETLIRLLDAQFFRNDIIMDMHVLEPVKLFALEDTPQFQGFQSRMNVLIGAVELASTDYKEMFNERGETISNLAEYFGMDADQLKHCIEAWYATTDVYVGKNEEGNSIFIEDDEELQKAHIANMLSNLGSMNSINKQMEQYIWQNKPENSDEISLQHLYNKFGIRAFGRYKFEDLLGQLTEYSSEDQPTLVISSLSDHNGAINKVTNDIWRGEVEKPVYTEAKNLQEVLRALRRGSKDYGALKNIIIAAHGASDGRSLDLGGEDERYGELTADQIESSLLTHKLVSENRLDSSGTVTFMVCSAGERDGIAQALSYQLANEEVRIVAADDLVYGLSKNEKGELSLMGSERNTDISLEYQNGYSRRLK